MDRALLLWHVKRITLSDLTEQAGTQINSRYSCFCFNLVERPIRLLDEFLRGNSFAPDRDTNTCLPRQFVCPHPDRSDAVDDDARSFFISGSSLVASNPSALTAGSYSVRVRSTDVAGNTYEQAFSITVTSNQAPSVTTPTAITLVDTSATDTFSNQTGTLAATDTDGVASYGVQGGTTGGSDSIGGVTYDVSKTGTYGSLYVKSSDGSYVYVPNATAINAQIGRAHV